MVSGLTINAQAINIHGTVSNSAGQPIVGATVKLTGQNLSATTGANGAYSITQTGVVKLPVVTAQPAQVSLNNGLLSISLPASYPVKVEVFDIKGTLFQKEIRQEVPAGVYSLNIAQNARTTNLLIIRATIGDLMLSFRCMPLSSGKSTINLSGDCTAPISASLKKRSAAVIDTIKVTSAGYLTKVLPIFSYDSTINITLDSTGSVVPSQGCGKTRTLQNGTITINYKGVSRKYILRAPDSYVNSTPYRLVFAYAWLGAPASQVASSNYFTFATLDSKNTIFVAPDAANGAGTWSKDDVAFTDTILSQLEDNFCIDKRRIFATGFSFGGAMSIAIACTRAEVFRAVAFFSGADLTGSCTATLKPIAYWASQASGDASGTPTPTSGRTIQAKFAEVNGCTADPNAITFPTANQPHTCTIYKNCSAAYPTIYCVFNGQHGWEPKDPGQSTSWAAPEAWRFITQF
jgi:poly(3-hydroxybutyrate) depolymerase